MGRMGKVSSSSAAAAAIRAAAEVASDTTMKKKKGRPSLADLQKRNLLLQQQQQQRQQRNKTLIDNTNNSPSSSSPNLNRRSSRRNPSPDLAADDDDEREEKKVKLVVRLPQSNQQPQNQYLDNSSLNSASFTSGSNDEGENPDKSLKKRKINAVDDRSGDVQEEKVLKATDTLHGTRLESGPTTPLPDKKLLVFILDRLQKKDTHAVFSEPVDPNELPDYHEIIEHPMDFGTVRKKLDSGLYSNLEELEADVLLICSNAMQYNPSDTIYFRQARSIQDLAKRDFENLRHEGEDGELRPKIVRRGRPPGKHPKKPFVNSSVDPVRPDRSSGASLASGEDNTGSNTYNLRKAPMLSRFLSADAVLTSHRSRNGENYSEWLADWNDEFPANILRADMKYGKKHFSIDETRRDTYKQFHPSTFVHEPSILSDLGGVAKQLMPVGLHLEHSYARSLARFAADLGPVVWKIASKKLESVLPPGMEFGPGFVGENDVSTKPPSFSIEKQKSSNSLACDGNPSRSVATSTSGVNPVVVSRSQVKDSMVEVDKRSNSWSELPTRNSAPFPGARPELTFHTQQKPVLPPARNGFNGVFGHSFPSQKNPLKEPVPAGRSGLQDASVHSQALGMVSRGDSASPHPGHQNNMNSEDPKCSGIFRRLDSGNLMIRNTGTDVHTMPDMGSLGKQSWQTLSGPPRQYSLPVSPDLNVGLQAPGSPSSRLRVGSPQQPDLALQL